MEVVKASPEWEEVQKISIPASVYKAAAIEGDDYMTSYHVIPRDLRQRVVSVIRGALQ